MQGYIVCNFVYFVLTAFAVVLMDAFGALGSFFPAPAEDSFSGSCGCGCCVASEGAATRVVPFFIFGCCGALLLLRAAMGGAFSVSEVPSSSFVLLSDTDAISTTVEEEEACLAASAFDKLSAVFDLALGFRTATAAVITGAGDEPSSKGGRSTNFCADDTCALACSATSDCKDFEELYRALFS